MNKGIALLPFTIATLYAPFVQAQEVTLFDYAEATSAFEEAYFNGNLDASKGKNDSETSYDFDASVEYERVFKLTRT